MAAVATVILLGASAGTASAGVDAITCTSNGCVAQGYSQGFATQTIVGGGVFESALCLGSKADPCDRLHGELIFDPHYIDVSGGYGDANAGVTIVPTLVSASAGGQTVQLSASNGAVGVVTIPDSGALCVNLRALSITTSPC